MTETETKHAAMVAALVKDPKEARQLITRPGVCTLIQSRIADILLCGSELDALKKFAFHNKQDLGLLLSAEKHAWLETPGDTARIGHQQAAFLHAAIGIVGEAIELLFAVHQHAFKNAALDIENCTEELGDLEFYLEDFRRRIGITRAQSLDHNMVKLATRYPNYQYTDQRAWERADKEPGQ